MIDFLFIEFYIKKKYGINSSEYFNVSTATTSKWRKKNILPELRLTLFQYKEGSIDVDTLFETLYNDITMDVIFMEFYIKKKYNEHLFDYFNTNKSTITFWRKNNKIPNNRLRYFESIEKDLDIQNLFKQLYKC